MAYRSKGLTMFGMPSRISVFVSGSIRTSAVLGTCFRQTMMFMQTLSPAALFQEGGDDLPAEGGEIVGLPGCDDRPVADDGLIHPLCAAWIMSSFMLKKLVTLRPRIMSADASIQPA